MTPTLNRAGMLEATLRSVRAQTYRNVEHLVMDGGSTDGTIDLLKRYRGTYRLEYRSKPDAGMYHAINEGLGIVRGEIVAYLNSDDLYFPWTVREVVRAFQREADAAFVFGDALAIDDATGRQQIYFKPPFDLDDIRRSGFLAQPTVFWRREVIDKDGVFDSSLRYVADCDYWMREGAHRRFFKVNELLAIERDHPTTLRHSVGSPLWAELERVRERYVVLKGEDHERRVVRQRRRMKAWVRGCSLLLLAFSLVPSPLRPPPWRNYLNSRRTGISRPRFLLRALPWLSRIPQIDRAIGEAVRPSRSWLEP